MLLDCIRQETPFAPYINTSTLFDFSNGEFLPGVHNPWVLNGGIPPTLGIVGREQTYKSAKAGTLLARALAVHPLAEAYVYDTEGAIKGSERYQQLVRANIEDRIVFKNTSMCSLTDFYDDICKVVDEKSKHKDDYIVESPFINHKTMQPYRIWIPTICLIDSLSYARSDIGEEQYGKAKSVDGSEMNTLWMKEGNIKTRIINDLPRKALKYGLYLILTAHIGDKLDLDMFHKTPKQLQYMKNTDRIKNVGSNFSFLMATMIQTFKAEVMTSKSSSGIVECEFPTSVSTPQEISEVTYGILRNKNNASGIELHDAISQYQGVLDSVTNFLLLKRYDNYGLEVNGNKSTYATVLLKDQKFSRRNIRELCDADYRLYRALEIVAQLCFIQHWWSTYKLPAYIRIKPEKLAELLYASSTCSIDRVLQSTGSWSTSPTDRELMTLFDILEFLHKEFDLTKDV